MKVQRITAIIYKAYFESLFDVTTGDPAAYEASKGRIMSCTVLATSVQQALDKIGQEFPGEIVSSIHSERDYKGPGRVEVILL